MQGQLWIEPVGGVLIARMRGVPDQKLLQDCQSRILELVKDTRQGLILHDCLEMETPQVEVPVSQWKLDQEIGSIHLRRAVVVPNTKLAYLARLAFGEGDVRVFYNDMAAALAWLTNGEQEGRLSLADVKNNAPSLPNVAGRNGHEGRFARSDSDA